MLDWLFSKRGEEGEFSLKVPLFYLAGLFSLFIVHSEGTSPHRSVCSRGGNNHPILYLYFLFIYIYNEVTESRRQNTLDLFPYAGLPLSGIHTRIITLPIRTDRFGVVRFLHSFIKLHFWSWFCSLLWCVIQNKVFCIAKEHFVFSLDSIAIVYGHDRNLSD